MAPFGNTKWSKFYNPNSKIFVFGRIFCLRPLWGAGGDKWSKCQKFCFCSQIHHIYTVCSFLCKKIIFNSDLKAPLGPQMVKITPKCFGCRDFIFREGSLFMGRRGPGIQIFKAAKNKCPPGNIICVAQSFSVYMLQYVSVFFLYGDFIIYEQGKWGFSFIPQSEEGAYSMGRATFLSSDRPLGSEWGAFLMFPGQTLVLSICSRNE